MARAVAKEVSPDLPAVADQHPFGRGHELLRALIGELFARRTEDWKLAELEHGKPIATADGATRLAVMCAALEVQSWLSDETREADERVVALKPRGDSNVDQFLRDGMSRVFEELSKRAMPADAAALAYVAGVVATHVDPPPKSGKAAWGAWGFPAPGAVGWIVQTTEKLAAAGPLDGETRGYIERIRNFVKENKFYGGFNKTLVKLDVLLSGADAGEPEAGEAWADALLADLRTIKPAKKAAWLAALEHARSGAAEPGEKWIREATKRLEAIGVGEFTKAVTRWIALVPSKPDRAITDRNAPMLRGLAWFLGVAASAECAAPLAELAVAGFTRFGSTNLQCAKVGKAALWALGRFEGLEKIALLDRVASRIKSPWALEQVAAARQAAGAKSGLSQRDLDELSVPTFDLPADGRVSQKFGDVAVELQLLPPGRVEFRLVDGKGKALKSLPKKVKDALGAEVDALKKRAKEIERTLTIQRHRIENLYLEDVSWPLAVWRERYLEHPLLGCVTRSLIWSVTIDGKNAGVAVLPDGKTLKDVDGKAIKASVDARVALWHPLDAKVKDVTAWRDRLTEAELAQPFKQAYREVYRLTDAERRTQTYSHRFAGHILRQHQLHALAEGRGWKHTYVGAWDSADGLRVARALPAFGLRAELWLESVPDSPQSDAGVMLYVSTEQVRFYREPGGEEPIALADVPARALSEIMRDVDLFVGVATVGNDPNWQPPAAGDRQQPLRDYWQSYSFGELTETACTRREALQRLVPKLAIASRCRLAEKFLIVRGDIRTYKIHLGSGNILMEPNDEYLCIVADRKTSGDDDVFLPFEGDGTLSIILSKAFLLAEDRKIKDATIMRQIGSKADH